MLSRRQFIQSALTGGAAISVGLSLNDLWSEGYTANFKLEHLEVAIPGLPSAFSGYRIGFITDIHIGTWVPEGWFERALDALSAQKIDLLLLGGDYILVHETSLWDEAGLIRNSRFRGLSKSLAIPEIYTTFAKCASRFNCPDGILAVVGNHDHWNDFNAFLSIMRGFPQIRLLINEEAAIRRGEHELVIFGADDYLTGVPQRPPTRELLDGRAKRIILSHNPDYLTAILSHSEIDFSLALCGHTHGGQIVLPFFGGIAAQVIDRRFVSGSRSIGEKQVYTSRGLGVVGLPFRINCPPEVTVISLQSGAFQFSPLST